jgi:hypothetical protein
MRISLAYLLVKGAHILFVDICDHVPLRLPKMHVQKSLHSIEAHFHDDGGSMSLAVLSIMAARTLTMYVNNRMILYISDLQDNNS